MSIAEYFNILWRRGWILILLALVTAASALLFSRLQSPLYRSKIEVLVQPARSDFGLSQSAKLFLNSYVAYLNTNARAQEVIEVMQLDTSPEALRGGVRMQSNIDTFVITIEVINGNGDLANDIARNWADLLVKWRNDENQRQRKEDRITAQILDAPTYSLYRPQTAVNTLAGGILGLLLGGVIIFILEYLEAGIMRTREDVERALDVSVLGAIPDN